MDLGADECDTTTNTMAHAITIRHITRVSGELAKEAGPGTIKSIRFAVFLPDTSRGSPPS